MAITLPGAPEHLYILSNDEIKEGDSVLYKETFTDGTVKTEFEYGSKGWTLCKSATKEDLPYFHRAQKGRNAASGISGCHKVIMSSDILLGLPIPIILSPDQLRGIITIAHTTGWNNGVGDKVTWSDTSFNKLKEQLFNLFKIEL